jgi:hypothetical protein
LRPAGASGRAAASPPISVYVFILVIDYYIQ